MHNETSTQAAGSGPYTQLLLLWISWFTLVALGGILELSKHYESYGLFLVVTHSAVALTLFMSRRSRFLAISLVLSFMFRIALMLIDIYVEGFSLPGSGGDTEGYYRSAIQISGDHSRFNGYIYGGVYSKFLGALVILGGPSREILQYTNVAAAVSIVILVAATVRGLGLSGRAERSAILLSSFLPYFLITSAILLRETLIALLLAISLHLMCKWLTQGGTHCIVFGLGSAAAATSLHSGVIAYLVAYLLAAILYERSTKTFSFTTRNLPALVIVVATSFAAVTLAPDIFLNQFDSLEEDDSLLSTVNNRAGGAAYLTGLTVETPAQLFLYSPLRAFYFLASPLPWDWRGAIDALTFILDSSAYTTIVALTAREVLRHRKQLPTTLTLVAIILLGSALVFGVGVSNSGTAVRHRIKLVPVLSLALAYIVHPRKEPRPTLT